MRYANPARLWMLAVAGSLGAGISVTALAVVWLLPDRPASGSSTGEQAAPPALVAYTKDLAPLKWQQITWRITDVKSATKPAADKPWDLQVVGVLTRQGKTVAAIEPSKGDPLLFIAAGETRNNITITRITTQEVDVEWSGEKRTLGVKP